MTDTWLADVLNRPGQGTWARTATHLAVIDSTNRVAMEEGMAGAGSGHLVIAEAQTAGRGRWGRTWTSEPGMNLLVSYVVRPGRPADGWTWIPLAAGLAVAEVVEVLLPGTEARVKWPNDVRIRGRKVAGILAESRIESADSGFGVVVVGIGLNVNQRRLDEVEGLHATSLAMEAGRDVDRARALGLLSDRLEDLVARGIADGCTIRTGLIDRLDGRGGPITLAMREGGERLTGILSGLDDSGSLIVETAAGTRTFASGEITIGSGSRS